MNEVTPQQEVDRAWAQVAYALQKEIKFLDLAKDPHVTAGDRASYRMRAREWNDTKLKEYRRYQKALKTLDCFQADDKVRKYPASAWAQKVIKEMSAFPLQEQSSDRLDTTGAVMGLQRWTLEELESARKRTQHLMGAIDRGYLFGTEGLQGLVGSPYRDGVNSCVQAEKATRLPHVPQRYRDQIDNHVRACVEARYPIRPSDFKEFLPIGWEVQEIKAVKDSYVVRIQGDDGEFRPVWIHLV